MALKGPKMNFQNQAFETVYLGKKHVRFEFHPSAKKIRRVISEKVMRLELSNGNSDVFS